LTLGWNIQSDEEDFVAMIITCPNCATGFKVSGAVFVDGARKVRCAQCGHSWLQELPPEETEQTAPLDENSGDSGLDLSDEASPELDVEDFDIEMPQLGSVSENDQSQTDDLSGGASALHDIESEAKGKNKKRSKSKTPTGANRRKWATVVGVAAGLVMLAGSAVYYRNEVCAYAPALAGVYSAMGLPVNLLGIEFAGIELKRKYENGFPVLSVRGEVVNISKTRRQVPDVHLGLRGPGGQEIYHWSINIGRTQLGPSERVKFVTRLASPPEEASKIIIKFKKPRLRRVGAL